MEAALVALRGGGAVLRVVVVVRRAAVLARGEVRAGGLLAGHGDPREPARARVWYGIPRRGEEGYVGLELEEGIGSSPGTNSPRDQFGHRFVGGTVDWSRPFELDTDED